MGASLLSMHTGLVAGETDDVSLLSQAPTRMLWADTYTEKCIALREETAERGRDSGRKTASGRKYWGSGLEIFPEVTLSSLSQNYSLH